MHDAPAQKRFSFDLLAVWALGATALLGVILFIPSASVSFYATKVLILAMGAIVAFVAYVIACLIRGSITVPPLKLLGAVWLLPLAYLLSTLFSGVHPLSAVFGVEIETDTLAFVLVLALLSSLAALALRGARDFKTFYALVGGGILVALVAQLGIIIAARFIPTLAPTGNLVGGFGDLGMLAGLGIVLSLLALRSLDLSKRLRYLAWIAIALSLFVLALVNSFVIWLLVAFFALGMFIESLMRRPGEGMPAELGGKVLASSIVTLLLSVFFMISGSTIGGAFASSLGVNTVDVRPSWQSTFLVGSHTYASSPLFGSGPGTFGEQWLKFRDRSLNDTIFWNIDFPAGIGYIPTSLVTTGLAGVIAWLAFLGLFVYAGVRMLLFRLPEDRLMRYATTASFAGASYALILSLFSTPGPVILALGFLMIGAFVSASRYSKGREEAGVVFANSPRVGFAVVFLLTLLLLASIAAAYLVLERFLASTYYGEASVALAAGNLDKAENALSRSISFAPTERAYRLAAATSIERMRIIANDANLSATAAQQQFQAALSNGVSAGLQSTELGASDYQNWTMLATVYQSVASLNVEGAYEAAKGAYERAIALNPSSPVLPFSLAQLELAQQNTKAAEDQLLASINLKRDYIPAILLLSQLEIQTGKAAEALQAAEAAAYFAPNDSAVLFQVGLLRSGTGDIAGAVAALSQAVDINPQYANARFFLAAMYANQGKYPEALEQMNAVASFSPENAAAVATDIASLEAGKNPFPLARLRSLGIPQPPVTEPQETK